MGDVDEGHVQLALQVHQFKLHVLAQPLIERAQRLIQIVQERLAYSNDGGLSEAILLISVRKQAQVADPAVSPADVTTAIRALEARGVVKRSAGRVSLSRRW
jgi:hypothetical protein